jgi:hypothetical protein
MIGSRSFERSISYGILGAIYGAGSMTLVRLGLYRVGLIDKMVPQAGTEWLSHELGVEPPTIRLLINSCMLCTAGVERPRRPILFGRMRRRSLGIGAAFVWRSGPWAL